MNNASKSFYHRFTTLALLNAATGPFDNGEHATVYADSTASNNGDYLRLNSTWLPPFATVTGTLAGGSYTAYLTRTGYIVHLYMTVVSTSVINLTTASVLLTLPSTLTPARQEYSQMGTLPSDFLFSVNPNGNVMASQTYTGVPSGSRFLFNFEYSLV